MLQAPCLPAAHSIELYLPPSCIEIVPFRPELFVVGTYNLESNQPQDTEKTLSDEEDQSTDIQYQPQSRSGSLLLYQLDNTGLYDFQVREPLGRCWVDSYRTFIQSIPTNSAVLDLHFSPNADPDKKDDWHAEFAAATSAGIIEYHSIASSMQSDLSITLKCIKIIQVCEPSLLILSLAFNTLESPSEILAFTLSDGSVGVLDLTEAVQAHTLEAWTVAWSSFVDDNGRQALYSGGDDSMLRVLLYSSRDTGQKEPKLPSSRSTECITTSANISASNIANSDDTAPSKATLDLGTGVKFHGAGVTAILPINLDLQGSSQAEILLTGSYDEFIRVLSSEPGGRWTLKTEKRLGGGVWRLKYLSQMEPSTGRLSRHSILASCMHAGARIVEVAHNTDDTWSIGIFARFEEHESMTYASDFVKTRDASSGREKTTVVSTSFYDRKLCVTHIPDLA